MKALLALLVLAGFTVAGETVEDIVKKHIAATGAPVKYKEIKHPDGTIETLYQFPDGSRIGIKEENSLVRAVPCEVQSNIKSCECGPACTCPVGQCKCDGTGCKCPGCLGPKKLIAEDNIPVITPDGKRFNSKAEYEASLQTKVTSGIGTGLSVQVGTKLFNIDANMAATAACQSINEQAAIYGNTITFYNNGIPVQPPTWYIKAPITYQPQTYYSQQPQTYYSQQPQIYYSQQPQVYQQAPRSYSTPTRYNSGQPPLVGANFGFSGPFGGGFQVSGGLGGCTTGG